MNNGIKNFSDVQLHQFTYSAVSCTQKLNKQERVATINTDNFCAFK